MMSYPPPPPAYGGMYPSNIPVNSFANVANANIQHIARDVSNGAGFAGWAGAPVYPQTVSSVSNTDMGSAGGQYQDTPGFGNPRSDFESFGRPNNTPYPAYDPSPIRPPVTANSIPLPPSHSSLPHSVFNQTSTPQAYHHPRSAEQTSVDNGPVLDGDFELRASARAMLPDLEEGELSSGEISNSTNRSYVKTPETRSYLVKERENGSRNSLNQRYLATSRGASSDMAEDPSSSPKAELLEAARQQNFHATGGNSGDPYLSPIAKAQMILQELHSYKIGLDDLTQEGLDPGLLRMLYAQMGIIPQAPLPSQQQLDALRTETANTKRDASLPKFNGTSNNCDQTLKSPQEAIVEVRTLRGDHSGADLERATLSTDPGRLIADGTNISKSPGLNKSISTIKGPGRELEPKPVDRKEYIARLLAAKAGKTISSPAEGAAPSEAHTNEPMKISPATKGSENADVTTTFGASRSANSEQSIHKQVEDPNVEAKRKAQTELARQKIEALRAQREAQNKADPIQDGSDDYPGMDLESESVPAAARPLATVITQANISSPSVSQRPSYFSPTSLEPAFNLPGLFTASGDVVLKSSAAEIKSPQVLQQDLKGPTPVGSTDYSETIEKLVSSQANIPPSAEAGPAMETASRKRQRAVDFLDSPSTRLKKISTRSEDNSVVIDISDGDDDDVASEGFSDRDRLRKKSPRTGPQTGFITANRQHTAGSGLPAFDPNHRNHIGQTYDSAAIADSNGKPKEPEVLKSKEIEIQQMNRKIAELEQRIKAKQMSTRTQSPVDKPPALESRRSPQTISQSELDSSLHKMPAYPRESSGNSEMASAHVPQEEGFSKAASSQAHLVTRPAHDALGSEESESLALDLLSRDPSHAANTGERAQEPQELFNGDAPESPKTAPDLSVDHAFRTSSRGQIEQTLSDLDQQIERVERSLQTRKMEMEQMESALALMKDRRVNVSKEFETRDNLVQEPSRSHTSALVSETGVESTESFAHRDLDWPEEPQKASPKPSSLVPADQHSSDPQPGVSGVTEDRSHFREAFSVLEQLQGPLEERVVLQTEVAPSLSEEADEDGMDISRSDTDEGEISSGDHDFDQNPQDIMEVNEDEEYEPPLEVGSPHESESLLPDSGEYPSRQSDLGLQPPSPLVSDRSNRILKEDNAVSNLSIPSAAVPFQDRQPQFSLGMSATSDRGSDDYEPPEANRALDAPVSLPTWHNAPDFSSVNNPNIIRLDGSREKIFDPPTSDPGVHNENHKDCNERVEDANELSTQTKESFKPYHSPLRSFKSYRFHPEYLKDVSDGFRSLTYSNAIQSDVPICPYEFGGVCNDASCPNQHFRKIGLPDDMILRDMGRAEGDTTNEQDSYITGLRDLIIGLRQRKVRELDLIANEISKYRMQRVGSGLKILSLEGDE